MDAPPARRRHELDVRRARRDHRRVYDDLDDPRDVLCDSDEPVRTLSVAVTPTLAARAIAYARARGLDLDDVVAEALDALVGAPG